MRERNQSEDGAPIPADQAPERVPWNSLRPTQGAIGYIQVLQKKASYLGMPTENREHFLADQAIKVVRGPLGGMHVVDHHHWARAWADLGLQEATVQVVADFSDLDQDSFLDKMSERGWLHPFDKDGRRISVQELPDLIEHIPDDVFQSLAAFLRTAKIYDNPGEFNAKFAWADFLRKHVDTRAPTVEGFAEMLSDAVWASRLPEAAELPGFISAWSKPHD